MLDNVDQKKIIIRLKQAQNIKHDKDLAKLLGLSQKNFNNRKQRGSLLEPLLDWVIHQRVDLNLHWLLTGEGEIYNKDRANRDLPAEVQELLEEAKKVLISGNQRAYDALKSNIQFFAEALDTEPERNELKDRLMVLEDKVDRLMEGRAASKKQDKEKPPPGGESQKRGVM